MNWKSHSLGRFTSSQTVKLCSFFQYFGPVSHSPCKKALMTSSSPTSTSGRLADHVEYAHATDTFIDQVSVEQISRLLLQMEVCDRKRLRCTATMTRSRSILLCSYKHENGRDMAVALRTVSSAGDVETGDLCTAAGACRAWQRPICVVGEMFDLTEGLLIQ